MRAGLRESGLAVREDLGGLVLAGGASLRMGGDKALADWAGRRAVDRVFDLASGLCGSPVLVCGGASQGFWRGPGR